MNEREIQFQTAERPARNSRSQKVSWLRVRFLLCVFLCLGLFVQTTSRSFASGQAVMWGNLVLPYVEPGTIFTNIAAGGLHRLAIRNDGVLFAWGWNEYGQSKVPAGVTNVVSVAGGYAFSVAAMQDGT